MSSKIARSLAAFAIVGAPFMIATAPTAAAAGGCTVDNTSTTTSTEVHISAPPPSVSATSTSATCSYISEGGTILYGCTLVAGRCEVYKNGALHGSCTTTRGTCEGTFEAAAGDVITLNVYGGSGYVRDAV